MWAKPNSSYEDNEECPKNQLTRRRGDPMKIKNERQKWRTSEEGQRNSSEEEEKDL